MLCHHQHAPVLIHFLQVITNLKGYRHDPTAATDGRWSPNASMHQHPHQQQQQRWGGDPSGSLGPPSPGAQSPSPTGWQMQSSLPGSRYPGEVITGDGASPGRGSIGGGGAAAAAAGAPGPPTLRFRSDKAYMTAQEVEQRARAAKELQDALAAQVAEKQRRKVRGWAVLGWWYLLRGCAVGTRTGGARSSRGGCPVHAAVGYCFNQHHWLVDVALAATKWWCCFSGGAA